MGIASMFIKAGLKKFFLPEYMQRPSASKVEQGLQSMRDYTKILGGQQNVSKVWLEHLIQAGKTDELKEIVRYLRSPAADSINVYSRAELIGKAISKMDFLKEVSHLIH